MKLRRILIAITFALYTVSSLANTVGEDTLRILFTGDVLLDRGVRKQLDLVGADSLMSGVRRLFHSEDAVIVNLECPLSSKSHPVSKQIVFRADTTMASALKRNGVTHAALANNHSIDQGFSGLEETYRSLTNAGIEVMGYGKDCHQRIAPTIISNGRAQVAVFNDNAVPLENWSRVSADRPDILNISVDSLCAEIKRYRRSCLEHQIVVFIHWGTEFNAVPNISQRIDAMKLIDAGACAVIGQHPHVVQPVQNFGGKIVCYSLGNFIFDQKGKGRDKGMAIELVFTANDLTDLRQIPIDIIDCRPEMK